MTISSLNDAGESEAVELPRERKCPFSPPSELGELRESRPLARLRFREGHEGWLVTSHELARAVLRDPRISSYFGADIVHPERRAAQLLKSIDALPNSIRALVDKYQQEGRLLDAFLDPEVVHALHEHPPSDVPFLWLHVPDHTRLRRILAPYFTARRVEEHRSRIEQIVADLLDAMERVGPPVDLIEAFAEPLPSLLTCALYGIPESEMGTFQRITAAERNPNTSLEDFLEAHEEFEEFARELVQSKRKHPGDDLLSALVVSGEMTENELVNTVTLLVDASHVTTTATLAFSVATLLQDRNLWNTLINGTADVGQILEELMRYNSPSQAAEARTALEDIEIGGTVIKAFENIIVSYSAANRDPEVFEDPDRVDLTRQATKHLAFGHGTHLCLGQHLARMEMQIALSALAKRFPTLDLAVPAADIPWHPAKRTLRGPQRLPVTW